MILAAAHSQEQSNPKWGKRQRSKRECLHIPPKNSKRTGVCNHFAPWGPLWVRGGGGVALVPGAWCRWRGLPTQRSVLPHLWGTGVADHQLRSRRADPTRPDRPDRDRPSRTSSLSHSRPTRPMAVSVPSVRFWWRVRRPRREVAQALCRDGVSVGGA